MRRHRRAAVQVCDSANSRVAWAQFLPLHPRFCISCVATRRANSSRVHVLNPELALVARAILAVTRAGDRTASLTAPAPFRHAPTHGFLAVLYALSTCERVSIGWWMG